MVRSKVARYHDVFEIYENQIQDFCGNALEAKNLNEEYFLIMSSRAFKAYTKEQKAILATYYKDIIHTDLKTNENYRGGSAPCI